MWCISPAIVATDTHLPVIKIEQNLIAWFHIQLIRDICAGNGIFQACIIFFFKTLDTKRKRQIGCKNKTGVSIFNFQLSQFSPIAVFLGLDLGIIELINRFVVNANQGTFFSVDIVFVRATPLPAQFRKFIRQP